ncbi:MAG: magnesium transporter [Thermomicrobiales bacterium]
MTPIAVATIRDLIRDRDASHLAHLAAEVHASDWADIIHQLDDAELAELIGLVPDAARVEILAEIDPGAAAQILDEQSADHSASILAAMDPDDATDVIAEMDDQRAGEVLAALPAEDSETLRGLLAYPEATAGALMTPEFVAIAPNLRADQAIEALRAIAADAEVVNYVYVLDREDHLLGVLSLRNLVLAPPQTLVRDLMISPAISVSASEQEQVAANLLRDRNLLALPVVDDDNRLLGVITHDDAQEVIENELTEDYLKLAGTDAEEMERRNPLQIARLRLPWLFGTMALELLAGLVIHNFDHVLQQVILLASFMPVISAISGNVGLQAAAIVVRGLDTGHVTLADWKRHVGRELSTSLIMALSCGLVLGVVGAIWSQHLPFGLVIGGAMTASMLTAGLMGTLIPMVSKRLGFDPATTAGPFETAFQDIVGFGVFLWLASLLIDFIS